MKVQILVEYKSAVDDGPQGLMMPSFEMPDLFWIYATDNLTHKNKKTPQCEEGILSHQGSRTGH